MAGSITNKISSGKIVYFLMPVLCLYFLVLSGNEIFPQDTKGLSTISDKEMQTLGQLPQDRHKPDDLSTITSVQRFVSANISYPESAVKAGHKGKVILYARVNQQGIINEVLELEPGSDYVALDEVVIVRNAPPDISVTKSSRQEELVCEGRRVIMALPRLDIPEIYGGLLKFSFRFELQ
jgi:hypothetical protein